MSNFINKKIRKNMKKKIIVTTTINPPTIALKKFMQLPDWDVVVVGDKKTPHQKYKKLNCVYLSPKDQEKISKKLSDLIGWNCIQRRNFGFIYALKNSYELIATVDDDNIPKKNWGQKILVGNDIEIDFFQTNQKVFDPLSVTNNKDLWHRGFPIELLYAKNKKKIKKRKIVECLVQADLWDGDPDIDAVCRISNLKPVRKFTKINPYSSNKFMPFNSQNTFLSPFAVKDYMMFPHVGRMDDIWGGYYLQKKIKKPFIVFSNSSVVQKRNDHNFAIDLKNEIVGYLDTLKFINDISNKILPIKTKKALEVYLSITNKIYKSNY